MKKKMLYSTIILFVVSDFDFYKQRRSGDKNQEKKIIELKVSAEANQGSNIKILSSIIVVERAILKNIIQLKNDKNGNKGKQEKKNNENDEPKNRLPSCFLQYSQRRMIFHLQLLKQEESMLSKANYQSNNKSQIFPFSLILGRLNKHFNL